MRRLHPGHDKIGLIIDKASMHTLNDVRDWMQNANLTEKPVIVHDFVEARITSMCQPPNVVINKPLKDTIKKTYGKCRNEIAQTFTPSETIQMSREKLTNLILEACTQINEENMRNMHVQRGFDLCSLNPHADEKCIQRKFMAYLDSLSITSAHQALIDYHVALELDEDKQNPIMLCICEQRT